MMILLTRIFCTCLYLNPNFGHIIFLFVVLLCNCQLTESKRPGHDVENELSKIDRLLPLLRQNSIVMFWRPQKVGSSTILSFLTSYAYRFNVIPRRKAPPNSLCIKMASCALKSLSLNLAPGVREALTKYASRVAPGAGGKEKANKPGAILQEKRAENQPYMMSTSHQLCNMRADVIFEVLPCAFTTDRVKPHIGEIKELFVVREPLSRAISAYYFWGELFKMRRARRMADRSGWESKGPRLGEATNAAGHVYSALFTYHGNETSAPPLSIAMKYAQKLPYKAGMPGPSFTWSAFANGLNDAVAIVRTDRMMTIVTERLDESLVAASHYLGWSIADMVVTVHRKALSKHPKASAWPLESITAIRSQLEEYGEYAVYEAAHRKLDERLSLLSKTGVNVEEEVLLLKALRKRVTEACLVPQRLEAYRRHLKNDGYDQHQSANRLRDAEDVYTDQGHSFSFNGEILYSFDLCGNCEAHVLLLSVTANKTLSVENAPLLSDITDKSLLEGNPNFSKCPR